MAHKSWVKGHAGSHRYRLLAKTGLRVQGAGVGVDQAAVTSGRDAVTRHCQSGAPLRDRSRQPTMPLTQSENAPRFRISQPLQIADFVRLAMVVTGSDAVRISAGSYAGARSVLSGGRAWNDFCAVARMPAGRQGSWTGGLSPRRCPLRLSSQLLACSAGIASAVAGIGSLLGRGPSTTTGRGELST
jgi:hypothetical protein